MIEKTMPAIIVRENMEQKLKDLEQEVLYYKKIEKETRKSRDALERHLNARTKELEELSAKLLSVQEEERKRIAGDLHDVIGQSLSAAKFMVETVLEQMRGEIVNPGVNSLKALIPMLQKASEEVRTIVMNLRPSILDNLGILATISWFCRQYQSVYSDINIEKDINISEREVSDELKTTIFRILQEAMNNIAKHSKAKLVQLSLEKSQNTIELIIRDNGQGFDIKNMMSGKAFEKGFGITSMKERTELSGGTFSISSEPGSGTAVRVSWKQ
jgi:signal transduction histidine kinase